MADETQGNPDIYEDNKALPLDVSQLVAMLGTSTSVTDIPPIRYPP